MKFVAESVLSNTGKVFFKVFYASDMCVNISNIKGDIQPKTLSLEDFKDVLGKAEKPVEEWCHLPKGFIPGIKDDSFIDGWLSPNGWSMVWRVKGAVRQLVHTSGHYRVPFPDILFFVRTDNNCFLEKFAWVIDDKGNLYQYPFGNVSVGGSICMGNISLKDVKSAEDFSEEFFLGKTNNDYFHEGNHVKPKYSQAELLRKLNGKDKFPKRWLLKEKRTLRDVLKMADPNTGGSDWY